MADETPLEPVEQKTIIFYDDELTAVLLEGGAIYVPVRRLCDNLGLDWSAQYRRIQRDSVLADSMMSVAVMATLIEEGSRARKGQEMLCLPLDLIPGWLFGVQPSRVREEIRPKLDRYRRDCFRVLWDAFKPEIMPATLGTDVGSALAPSTAEMTSAEQALATIEALYALAKQQVAMEHWLAAHDVRIDAVEDHLMTMDGRLDKAAQVVGEQARRLRRIELTLAGGATITDAQAASVSEAVKALAFELGKAEPDKGNPYQRVYAELYRKFRVPSYRALPLETYPAVIAWLGEWWQQVTEEPLPFGDQSGR